MGVADDRKNPLGPTGHQVCRNLKRLREERGLTKKQLSDAVGELGRSIPPLGISRVESGTRRVDADDLVALAVALGVNVSTLLLPDTIEGETEVTGAGAVSAAQAWKWADGSKPLTIPEGDDGTAELDFTRWARPRGLRGRINITTTAGRRAFREFAHAAGGTETVNPDGSITLTVPGAAEQSEGGASGSGLD